MADTITTKKVTDLTENSAPADEDLILVGNAGTAVLRKIKWSNILAAIKTKIASWAFDTLTTTDKTILGALNELNSKTLQKNSAEDGKNANSIRALGYYNISNTDNSWTNLPDGATTGLLVVLENWRVAQLLLANNGVFYRYIASPNYTFDDVDWVKL